MLKTFLTVIRSHGRVKIDRTYIYIYIYSSYYFNNDLNYELKKLTIFYAEVIPDGDSITWPNQNRSKLVY
jgi:hypothetical protein